MAKTYKTSAWQENFIRAHSTEYTAPELVKILKLERMDIYNFFNREKLTLKLVPRKKRNKSNLKIPVYTRNNPEPAKKLMRRPPTIYGNLPSPLGVYRNLPINQL